MTAARGPASAPDVRPPRVPRPRPPELAESPRIARLRAELERDPAAAARFWAEVGREGSPLVEPLDRERRIVTFLWRDAHGAGAGTRRVVLMANRLTDPSVWEESTLARLPGTDVWHRSYVLPATWRASYQLADDDGAVAVEAARTGPAARWRGLAAIGRHDPLNPRQVPMRRGGVGSVVELPAAPAQPWLERRAGVSAAAVEEHLVPSALGGPRRVWAHRPAGAGAGARLLVVIDGDDWVANLGLPTILDNLAADGVGPLLTLLVDSGDHATRAGELTDDRRFREFLAAELPAWARRNLGASDRGAILAGQSLGGLTALRCALEAPQSFGAVVAQSASLWWAPGGPAEDPAAGDSWAARRFAATPPGPVRVRLEVGRLEWVLLPLHRHLRQAMRAGGWDVSYAEFEGGHDRVCWRAALPAAIAEPSGR